MLTFTGGTANFSAAQANATDDYNGTCRTTGGGKELVYEFTTTTAQHVVASATGALYVFEYDLNNPPTCPVCFRPLETVDKKKKLAFHVG